MAMMPIDNGVNTETEGRRDRTGQDDNEEEVYIQGTEKIDNGKHRANGEIRK